MDSFLIKNNIIKKNKVIVEICRENIKLLGVHYCGNKVSVTGSYSVEIGKETDAKKIAKEVNNCLQRTKVIKNGDIILSIPSDIVQYRIEGARNTKISDLGKYILQNNQLNKVNVQTHIIDWSFMGEREENGDTVKYYMVAAVSKSAVMPFIHEFKKCGMNISTVTFSENNMVCLSDLSHDAGINSSFAMSMVNRLYIDFGIEDSRILVESGGVFVYSKVIDVGINRDSPKDALKNELIRIIRMCDNDGIEISEIIGMGKITEQILADFNTDDITVRIVNSNLWNRQVCNRYTLSVELPALEQDCILMIGAGLSVIHQNKRLNLIPQEHKEKQTNKYLSYTLGAIASAIVLLLAITYIELGISKYTLHKLQIEDYQYTQKLARIDSFEQANKAGREFIAHYEKTNFPFYEFMQFINHNKPYGLTIISVDSANSLPNNHQMPDESDGQQEDSQPENNQSVETEEASGNAIQYTKDISEEKLIIRGYSDNPSDISVFLYDLAKIPYIAGTELKAIEENKIGDDNISLFEIILTSGGETHK